LALTVNFDNLIRLETWGGPLEKLFHPEPVSGEIKTKGPGGKK